MRNRLIIIIGIIFLLNFKAFASEIPVENVFKDVDSSYKYYNELQFLYDKGIFFPNSSGNFNGTGEITKDELYGILVEANCNSCIKPYSSIENINKYEGKEYFTDVENSNIYSYCLGIASDNKYYGVLNTQGCQNGTSNSGGVNFCKDDKVSLDQAIAIILNISNLYSQEDNEKAIDRALNNGSVNIYYGYLEKAKKLKITQYDKSGNKKTYKFIDDNADFKKNTTREQLLQMIYFISKNKPCKTKEKNKIATQIQIFDENCNSENDNCNQINISENSKIYDLKANTSTDCIPGISDENIIWKFFNSDTNEIILKTGEYIDNFAFENGNRKIFLNVTDKCENSGESTLDANLNGKNSFLNVIAKSDKISGQKPMEVNFEAIVNGGDNAYNYYWDFGDGEKGNGKTPSHVYNKIGVYNVNLIVYDGEKNYGKNSLNIQTIGSDENCKDLDSDNDGINDCEDLCPFLEGIEENNGCPIYNNCGENCACKDGFTCSVNDTNTCEEKGICVKNNSNSNSLSQLNVTEACLRQLGDNIIIGNVVCNSCPCKNKLDYNAEVRPCDIFFPSINSRDNKKIYSAGSKYTLENNK